MTADRGNGIRHIEVGQPRTAHKGILANAGNRFWNSQIGHFITIQIEMTGKAKRIGIIITKIDVTPCFNIGDIDFGEF